MIQFAPSVALYNSTSARESLSRQGPAMAAQLSGSVLLPATARCRWAVNCQEAGLWPYSACLKKGAPDSGSARFGCAGQYDAAQRIRTKITARFMIDGGFAGDSVTLSRMALFVSRPAHQYLIRLRWLSMTLSRISPVKNTVSPVYGIRHFE
ncbi:MAG: hypothetical protein H6558_08170 [Lewinellaceae bacterium]|nr:hypothetical protein [Lewinellaceae bacterium]